MNINNKIRCEVINLSKNQIAYTLSLPLGGLKYMIMWSKHMFCYKAQRCMNYLNEHEQHCPEIDFIAIFIGLL